MKRCKALLSISTCGGKGGRRAGGGGASVGARRARLGARGAGHR